MRTSLMESICENYPASLYGIRFLWLVMCMMPMGFKWHKVIKGLHSVKPGRRRGTPVARWSRAERAAIRVPGGGPGRGRRPRADEPAGRRPGPVVPVAAAALHRLGAGRAPRQPPGAAALAR